MKIWQKKAKFKLFFCFNADAKTASWSFGIEDYNRLGKSNL